MCGSGLLIRTLDWPKHPNHQPVYFAHPNWDNQPEEGGPVSMDLCCPLLEGRAAQ